MNVQRATIAQPVQLSLSNAHLVLTTENLAVWYKLTANRVPLAHTAQRAARSPSCVVPDTSARQNHPRKLHALAVTTVMKTMTSRHALVQLTITVSEVRPNLSNARLMKSTSVSTEQRCHAIVALALR